VYLNSDEERLQPMTITSIKSGFINLIYITFHPVEVNDEGTHIVLFTFGHEDYINEIPIECVWK